jgi:hypothetical protein
MPERELAVIDYRSGYRGLVTAMRERAASRRIAIGGERVTHLLLGEVAFTVAAANAPLRHDQFRPGLGRARIEVSRGAG